MVTSSDDKLSGIYEHLLFKICLYYTFGPENLKEVASLFNRIHGKRLSAKQITDAYEHMHNTKHKSFERARDLNRDNREQLVNILKDELSYPHDKLREWIIQPSRPMAGLTKASRDERRKEVTGGDLENSMIDDSIMVESIRDSGGGDHRGG